jgi:hypothetical protein
MGISLERLVRSSFQSERRSLIAKKRNSATAPKDGHDVPVISDDGGFEFGCVRRCSFSIDGEIAKPASERMNDHLRRDACRVDRAAQGAGSLLGLRGTEQFELMDQVGMEG